jgi:hypothetical protein
MWAPAHNDTFTFVAHPGSTPSVERVDLLACSIAQQSCDVSARDVGGAGGDQVIALDMPLG